MAFKKRALLPPLIIILAIVIVVVMTSLRPQPPERTKERPAVLVETLEVQPETVQFNIAGQGNVNPKISTHIIAQVTGQVIDIADNFVNGGFFKKGDVLLTIDPADYQVALQTAKANLAQAKANLAEESARAKVAKDEWESLQMGDIPALGIREPQVASAAAAVQSAQASVAKAQRDLERTVIRAPFDGIMQSKNVDMGQFVTMNTKVAALYGSEVAEIRVPLSDRDLAYIDMPEANHNGAFPAVELVAEVAGQEYRWFGNLVRSEGVLDNNSRVMYGVVEVQDPYNQLGQTHETPLYFSRFVRLSIQGYEAADVFVIPRYAMTISGKVWLVDEERRLFEREVSVLRSEENQLIVNAGLNAGDQVVLTQVPNALPSMKVRVLGDPLPPQQETAETGQALTAQMQESSDE